MKRLLYIIVSIVIALSGCSREWSETTLIAYDDGTYIFIMDEDGYNAYLLTNGTHPSFSPDGEYIVFRRTTDLFIMNIETGQEKLITSDAGLFPYSTWSPDGSKIAFMKNNRLYTVNTDGVVDPEISSVNTNQGPISWSSDSKTIACTNNGTGEIYYFNLSDHVRSSTGTIAVIGLSFSPTGDKIVYADATNLYIANTDFTSTIILTNISDKNPSWSSDGKRIVYASIAGELRIINAAGGVYTQISGAGYDNPCFQYKPH
jgi:Tol biopolymer transport system component